MPYVLNTQRGTTITHPVAGRLPYGIAVPIKEEWINMLKHINGLTTFDSVRGKDSIKTNVKSNTELFGINIDNPNPETKGEIHEPQIN